MFPPIPAFPLDLPGKSLYNSTQLKKLGGKTMKNSEKTLDMIVNLCKSRGFVYAGSEIYGGHT